MAAHTAGFMTVTCGLTAKKPEPAPRPMLVSRVWDYFSFLPVTFASLLSQTRLSSVTFVRPTQGVKTFGNISSPFCTLASIWPLCKILRRSFQGNPSVGALNATGVAKYSDVICSGISSPGEFLVIFQCGLCVCVCVWNVLGNVGHCARPDTSRRCSWWLRWRPTIPSSPQWRCTAP